MGVGCVENTINYCACIKSGLLAMIFLLFLAPLLVAGFNGTLLDYVTDVEDTVVDLYANIFTCPSAACENGGNLLSNGTDVSCVCPEFFEGPCCAIRRCVMGGMLEEATCICPKGQSGDHCEKLSCNSGNLVYHGGRHFCHCPSDAEGKFCEYPRCLNDGVLHAREFFVDKATRGHSKLDDQTEGQDDIDRHYICDCKPGYYGPKCEYIGCVHGYRRRHNSRYFCQCDISYTGVFCEEVHFGVFCLLAFCVAVVAAACLGVALYWARRALVRKPTRTVLVRNSARSETGQPLMAPPPKPRRRNKDNSISRL